MKAVASKQPLSSDIGSVLKLIEDFGSLLQKETAALKKVDFKTVDALQEQKRDYAQRYSTLVTGLSERKAEIAQLDLKTRERLILARTAFTEILNDNLRTLEAAKDGTKRLVGRILDAARRAVIDDKQTNYSAKGQTQAYKTSTLSLSVDQKL